VNVLNRDPEWIFDPRTMHVDRDLELLNGEWFRRWSGRVATVVATVVASVTTGAGLGIGTVVLTGWRLP
jgi:hypothetical protein